MTRAPKGTAEASTLLRRAGPRELLRARELAEIVLADTALAILLDALQLEHPCMDEPHEHDPPTLREARRLSRRVEGLRADLLRYRDAVLLVHESALEIPF